MSKNLDFTRNSKELRDTMKWNKVVYTREQLKTAKGTIGDIIFQKDIDLKYEWVEPQLTDNGGTIINVNGDTTGSWKYINYGKLERIKPKWFDIPEGSPYTATDSTDKMEKLIDYCSTVRSGKDTAVEIEINGYIYISRTLNVQRCILIGRTNRDMIVWMGGTTASSGYEYMLDFGYASFSGLINLSVRTFSGYIKNGSGNPTHTGDDGAECVKDGIDSILNFNLVDFNHITQNVQLMGGLGDAIIIGELVNFNIYSIRTDGSCGYLVNVTQHIGANRPLNIFGLTIDNALRNTPDIQSLPISKGLIKHVGGVNVEVNGSRLEYNRSGTNTDFTIVDATDKLSNNNYPDKVVIIGTSGYNVASGKKSLIRQHDNQNAITVSTNSSGLDSFSQIHYIDSDTLVGDVNSDNANNAGASKYSSSISVGDTNILSYSIKELSYLQGFVKQKDIKLPLAGDLEDLGLFDIDDDTVYVRTKSGYKNIGSHIDAVAGDNFITPRGGVSGIKPKAKIIVNGASDTGDNLITRIESIDTTAGKVYISDTIGTDISDGLCSYLGSTFIPIYLKPIKGGLQNFHDTLPNRPEYFGTSFYDYDGQRVVTQVSKSYGSSFDSRFLYENGTPFSTADRPAYTSEKPFIGKYIFDTDLNRPISWTGSKWVFSDGTDA